jgi:hypothetical protein
VAAALVAVALLLARAHEQAIEPRPEDVPPPPPPEAAEAAEMPEHVAWIAVGGGSEPELNQISLEEDLLLAESVLGPGGVVLFAGGPGTRSVQVLAELDRGDPLRATLAELLAERGGRDATYVPTRLVPHGPATADRFEETLVTALADGDDPLLAFFTVHGDRDERPSDAVVLLWAGDTIDPNELDRMVRESGTARQVRFVVTSCFGGGFAEIAFENTDAMQGPTSLDVCGLFATSWDEPASGCDPSPERAQHEGYAIHLLEALRGRSRDGSDARAQIDLDGDGAIGLLEAHARARTHSLAFDLPTTTSNRLLRTIAPRRGRSDPFPLPEEEAVVRIIGERLRLADAADADARLDAIARRRVELEGALEARRAEADEQWWALQGELLSRWPVIDDPWHPDFAATIERDGDAIGELLAESPRLGAWREAREDLDAMESTLAAMRVEAAPLRRWLEAHETIELAARLHAAGGEGWERWLRMRACEAAPP